MAVGYIMFFYSEHPFPSSPMRRYDLLYNPIEASSIYGIVFIACVYLLEQQRTVKMQLLYWGMLPALFSYMLLVQSRGPLLALPVTIFAWQILGWLLYKGGKDNHGNKLLVLLLLICAASVASFMVYPEFFKSFFLRESYRLEIWGKILVKVRDAPCFGHGLNADTADTRTIMSDGSVMLHPHSVYLTTLYYGGIVGLLLLVALLSLAIWQGVTRVGKPQSFLLTCMVMFGALCMVTDGKTIIQHPKPFWIFFWFPIALVAASELPGNLLRDEKRTTMGIGDEVSAPE
jgi:O-antigen ligase